MISSLINKNFTARTSGAEKLALWENFSDGFKKLKEVGKKNKHRLN